MKEKTSDEKFIEKFCNNPTRYDSLMLKAAKKQFEFDTKYMTEPKVKIYK